jgi:hypothetical protein
VFFKNLIGARINQEMNDAESSAVKDYSILLILFSSTMILSPGFMMAMQPSWWNRANLKHTYLGVMITEFGTAVVLALIINQITNLSLQSVQIRKTKVKKRFSTKVISSSMRKHQILRRRVSIYFALILIINFNHNWRVSGENTGRNFQYDSWQHLTKTSKVFEDVKDSDIFISTNQNDAFETNAGSFFANTGIRLAYLFNTNSIFPNFSNCDLGSECALEGIRQKSIATLSNLTRGTFVPRLADNSRIDDWVGINLRKGALEKNTIWAFDTFLLTPTTYFSYLVPFLNDEKQASVDFTKVKVVTITSNLKNDFGPAIANVCLIQDGSEVSRAGYLMTHWKVPSMALDPSGALVKPSKRLDYREVRAGTCALK